MKIDWPATIRVRESIQKNMRELFSQKEKETDPDKIEKINQLLLKLSDRLGIFVVENENN